MPNLNSGEQHKAEPQESIPLTNGNEPKSASQADNTVVKIPPKPSKTPLYAMLGASLIIVLCLSYVLFFAGNKNPVKTSTTETKTTVESDPSKSENEKFPNAQPAITQPEVQKQISSLARKQADDPLARGKFDAPVLLIEFADFSCPMCYLFENDIAPQLEDYIKKGLVRIEYHHMTIFADRYHSDLAAKASIAAGRQGKFWDFLAAAGKLSQKNRAEKGDGHITWNNDLVKKIATEIGVADIAKFEKDITAPEVEEQVVKESIQGQQGFQGTPAFLVNNRPIPGAYPAETFHDTIKAALEDAKKGQ